MPTPLSLETAFQIDFNVHWVPAALGLDVPPASAAAMLGITEAEFTDYVSDVAAEVNQTAIRLLSQPDIATAIERLPIPPGATVMTLGDSITIYRRGYAELLRTMFARRRAADQIRFVNVAQSGYTSVHGLENTYTQFLAQQPAWVFIMFGVNDCKHFGGPDVRTLVSRDEFRENLRAMVKAFLRHTPAHIVLLTPTPVVELVVNHNPDFAAMRMTWDNADIQACGDIVRTLAREHGLYFVDLIAALGTDPDPALYLPDGLHPAARGHELILQHIIRSLASGQ